MEEEEEGGKGVVEEIKRRKQRRDNVDKVEEDRGIERRRREMRGVGEQNLWRGGKILERKLERSIVER